MKYNLLLIATILLHSSTCMVWAQSQTNELTDIYIRYNQGLISKEEAVQAVLMAENKKELDFYGQLVNQHHQPVAGAKVHGSVLLNVSFVSSGGTRHETETDAQGRFSFLGIHGVRLGMRFEKEGYYYDGKRPSQRPDDYKPDAGKPIVFTIWKTNGAQPLIHDEKFYGMNPDGRFYTLDLIDRKKVEGQMNAGDLVVQIKRPAQVKPREKFDWEVNLSVNDGGLIEVAQRDYMLEAPDSGYQSQYRFQMKASTRVWHNAVTKTFFLKSRHGQVYGHLQITVDAEYQDAAAFEINSYINPKASRNLEFDKAIQIP